MRFLLRGWVFGFVSLSVMLTGCGTASTPVADTNADDPLMASRMNEEDGALLLAVPGPDGKGADKKGKVSQAAAKAGANLVPKALGGKRPGTLPDEDHAARKVADKGSPEWLLSEIQRVRLLPLPHEDDDDNESEDFEEDEQPLTPEQEKKLAQAIEHSKGIRRERNLQVIKLAEECLQKTSKNPEQEPLFCAAVHHLLDARLQLALQGDKESIESLYEAESLFFERNPKSESASEAALTLVNLAHANALRYGTKEPRWLTEFSKRAQVYATRFPDEQPRSVPLLMAAARSCENNGQLEEARTCYGLLTSKFAQSPQGQQAEGVLRRMQLTGNELELSAPGIDGSDIDLKAYKGKMVLVVFWASNAQPFVQQLPKIQEVTAKYKKACTVVGVNLDLEESAVESFVEKTNLDWQQIFFPSKSQRGWNSPVAVYYGVNSLPTMWLVDPTGVVAETNLDASNLEAKLREVYTAFSKKK
ncbi:MULTISPECIES: redoxin domain-containing protein [unclassified Schlesneria]|uniref:redoxin domain-containing protein n=1 Tax=Schlesneria TaxID=656899 RepID=UPI00359F25CB